MKKKFSNCIIISFSCTSNMGFKQTGTSSKRTGFGTGTL